MVEDPGGCRASGFRFFFLFWRWGFLGLSGSRFVARSGSVVRCLVWDQRLPVVPAELISNLQPTPHRTLIHNYIYVCIYIYM